MTLVLFLIYFITLPSGGIIVNSQQVFFRDKDEDRRVPLAQLRVMAERFGMMLLGYCLMLNHVHLLGVPLQERLLAQTIGQTHFRYTMTVNTRMGRTQHL